MKFKEFYEITKRYFAQDSVKKQGINMVKYLCILMLGYLIGKKVGAFRQREKEFDRKVCDTEKSTNLTEIINLGSKQREMEQYGLDDDDTEE